MVASVPALVRPYLDTEDAAGTFRTFRSAVLDTARADYDPAQIAAWAGPEDVDLGEWNSRRMAAHTFVAVVAGEVVGFADFRDDGVLDMLFVRPEWGGRGIARQLVDMVKRKAKAAGLRSLRTFASRTARPAFERFGFTVVADRPDNTVRGQIVPNYEMRCDLEAWR
jgi:putative acetyltransferase